MIKCDHCRRELSRNVQRYWQMRFCSPACVDAYRRRLDDDTRLKIRRLDVAATGHRALPWPGGLIQALPR
jgi:hypothetical protein